MKSVFRDLTGVFVLDKPEGISSNQALQRIKCLFQAKKAGHTGSLDVLATGLLPICFGEATKFSQFLLDADKFYRVTAELGKKTTTSDREGSIIEQRSTQHVSDAFLQKILAKFVGHVQQVPSMYSALKHQGTPLYRLARQGKTVERPARSIQIYELRLIHRDHDFMTLEVRCSKGTYIRTLVEDIGEELRCGAYVTELRRLAVGSLKESRMISLEQVETIFEEGGLAALDKTLLPIGAMLLHLPICILSTQEAQALQFGQTIQSPCQEFGLVRLYMDDDQFIGMGEVLKTGILKAHRLLSFAHNL
ncbi:MAG: tRNA pseudouridine(55) synthase TruB [Gammaproteobacteria bacterium]|nr:tRNA pseudouridine(55) synthase TruB [Gammaproteobacteria bacterium]MBU1927252.1 tRNA pseudouridine(55) synthase TruB [Gammaproteobacteria bacterium]